jgi:hypothetical protein
VGVDVVVTGCGCPSAAARVLPSDEELAQEDATIQSLANDFLGELPE